MAPSAEKGILSLGGKKMREEPREEEAKEASYEAQIENDLADFEKKKGQERAMADQLFALYHFNLNGGQELLEECGAVKVFGAVKQLAASEDLVGMMDLIKNLEPDAKKRKELYGQLIERAENRFQREERAYEEAVPGGSERKSSGYAFGTNDFQVRWQNKQVHLSVMQEGDAVLGRFKAPHAELYSEQALGRMQDQVKLGQLEYLVKRLSEAGNEISAAGIGLELEREKLRVEIFSAADGICLKIEGRLLAIRAEVDTESDKKIGPLLKELAQLQEFGASDPETASLIEPKTRAIMEEIAELRERGDETYAQKTSGIQQLLEKAKAARSTV